MDMGKIVIALVFTLSVVFLSAAQTTEDEGFICLATLPNSAQAQDHDYPGGKAPREYQYKFAVQFDEGERVEIPRDTPHPVSGLAARKNHVVRIYDADRLIESFSFTFEARGAKELCLSYTPWYQTWQLDPPRPGAKWCKCRLKR
jgi:hypothetical protein